jgi:hypothetical protein
MSSSEKQLAVGSWQLAARGGSVRRVLYCLLLTANCLLFLGCRQDMQDQPRYEVYEPSGFFKDGLSSRHLVEGTVPRGYLRADKQLYTGKIAGAAGANSNSNSATQGNSQGGEETTSGASASSGGNQNTQAGASAGGQANSTGSPVPATANTQEGKAGEADDATDFPFPVTAEVMARGRERFEIFCAMCHGYTGEGDGMIVRRGFRRPTSYHDNRLRQAPVGYFFRVMTEGFGAMPPYRAQIPVQDRWAIAAYIRALQLSQMNQQLAPAHGAETQPAAGGHR